MKNKLPDLNNHLFAQLERLGDEDLTPEQVAVESQRAEAMVDVADKIIKGAALQLNAAQILAQSGRDGAAIRDRFKMIDPPREFPTVVSIENKAKNAKS